MSMVVPGETCARPARWRRRARMFWRIVTSSGIIMTGAAIIVFWCLVALLAPLIAPYNPNASDLTALASPGPSTKHWLGTDNLGRDILSRIIWGARTILSVVPLAVGAAYAVGIAVGLTTGYLGGIVDAVLTRISDVIMAFPSLIIYIVLIAAIGPSLTNIIIAIALGSAPQIARLVRGATLEIKAREYVAAAELRGETWVFITLTEILPNLRQLLLTDACVRFGFTIVAIAVLGFLGMGLPPPTPDWGGMVREASRFLTVWPHMAIFPSLAVSSLVVGFSLFADGLNARERER